MASATNQAANALLNAARRELASQPYMAAETQVTMPWQMTMLDRKSILNRLCRELGFFLGEPDGV